MNPFSFLKTKYSSLQTSHRIIVICLVIIFLFFAALGGYTFGYKKLLSKDNTASQSSKVVAGKVEEKKDFPNPINGVLFKKSEALAWVNQLPIAVMIENHVQSRPQKGLSSADVVYEALAEGGITRFMAVFLQNNSPVGPIRSARPYYLDWSSEYEAAYAHYGGSPDALAKIKTVGIKDLDGLSIGAPLFQRVPKPGVASEHTVFSAIEQLRDKAISKGYKKSAEIKSWKFLDTEPALKDRPAAFSLKLGFLGTACFNVEWRYRPETNSYLRFECNAAHIDAANNQQIEAKTIILETVSYRPNATGYGRIDMDTIGSGELKVFENGTVISGSWKKDSLSARTQLFDSKGNDIKLNRGKIWVDIIPPGSSVTY